MSDERARLFVALELPPATRRALADWASVHLRDVTRTRRLHPASLHVTLCFLGSHPVADVPEIARACRMVGAVQRVQLSLGPARWLPARAPRAVAVELAQAGGGLSRLQSTLSRALVDGGWYEPERRPFLAHVTVARVARGAPRQQTELTAPAPLRFVGETVTLLRSHTDPGGARYQALETVSLGE